MNMIEAHAAGRRRKCDCKPLIFIVTSRTETQRIPVFTRKRNPSLLDQMFPLKYRYKNVRIWSARCKQCSCLYFSSNTKGWLIENFKRCKLDYVISKGEQG